MNVREVAEGWLALDPDPVTRAETLALIATGDEELLASRFVGRLQFGTAGIRAALGAGPQRMNRLVVRQTAAGLAADLLATVPDAASKGVVIGGDARHGTKEFIEDFACVLAAAGIKTMRFTEPIPTPVVAYATKQLDVAAGVCVTASHNPPADNGVKVYWGDGAQIVPPMDGRIAEAIDLAAAGAIEMVSLDHELCTLIDPSVVEQYVAGVHALDPHQSTAAERAALKVVLTPMHGVGGALATRILHEAGFINVTAVTEQFTPDPDFPTVSFPNPEEPGALDLAFALGRRVNADLVVANDPDADRCALAVQDHRVEGDWRRLSGDEVGWLLATHLLGAAAADSSKKLLITTLVSSSLLSKMAAFWGAEYVETLTGFKWLARAAMEHPEHRLILAYEEALGYSVGDLVADKDGLSAALVACDMAARYKADGSSLLNLLSVIESTYGRHDTSQWSLRFDGPTAADDMAALMARARSVRPASIAGCEVVHTRDYLLSNPPADVLVFDLGSVGRITVRPSGTEPKCKVYFEVVTPESGVEPVTVGALTNAMADILGVPKPA